MSDPATMSHPAEKHFGVSWSDLDASNKKIFLAELENHTMTHPEDVNFTIEVGRDGKPQVGRCLEEGCEGTTFDIMRRVGKVRVPSLSEYRNHIEQHSTHTTKRDARVRRRRRPSTFSRLSSVKKEDAPSVVPSSTSSFRKRSHSMATKSEPKETTIKSEPQDVIEISDDENEIHRIASQLLKRRKINNGIELLAAANHSTISINAQKEDMRDRIREIQSEIQAAMKRVQLVKHKSSPNKGDKTRLANEEAKLSQLRAKKNHFERALGVLGARKPDEATNDTHEPLDVFLLTAFTSRDINAETSTFKNIKPDPDVEIKSVILKKRGDHSNAFASSSRLEAPAVARHPLGYAGEDFDVDMDATVQAPGPSGGKPRDLDDLVLPAVYRDDPYDEEGDWFGRGKDTYVGPQASADDIEKFLVGAGNAELFDSNVTVGKALEELKLPNLQATMPHMSVALMPHQVIGVAWMLQRERADRLNGGCLADEMGLGKTVQMIATMVANYPKKKTRVSSTLILAPLALLPQWQAEIEEKTDGSFKTIIYHGNNKPHDVDDILEYDFVITTLSTLALEWPDPEEGVRREKAAKKAKTKGLVDDFVVADDSDDEGASMRQKPKGKGKKNSLGPLFNMSWLRVVVDEAHMIKNRKTRVSRAVTNLTSTYRWALTGTPIVNSLQDAYGIIRFLQIRPWYDWKEFNSRIASLERKNPKLAAERLQTIYKTVQLRRKKDSKLNGEPIIKLPPREVKVIKIEFSKEERDIYTMIETKEKATFNRFLRAGTVLKNYHQIFVMILRLRQLCSHSSLIQDDMTSHLTIGDQDDDGLTQDNRDELARASQLLGVNFVAKMKDQRMKFAQERMAAEKEDADATIEQEECAICLDVPTEPVITQCGHVYCHDCIVDVFNRPRQEADGTYDASKERDCPNCRGVITQDRVFALTAFEPSDSELQNEPAKARTHILIDSDIETLDESKGEKPSRQSKGKGKAKPTRRRVSYIDSEDDEEHSELDDELSDFIIDDDDDEDEFEARRELKKRLTGKSQSRKAPRRKGNVVLDSEDELELEEAELIFGQKKRNMDKSVDLDPKELKLMSRFLPSAKMTYMMSVIVDWHNRYPDEKILILSQWTSCLNLISNYLIENDVVHVQYRGDMTLPKRQMSVGIFQSKEKARVMLISRACGGVGLNLTRGNRVICMDLAWSEAVENQAWSRVHRLGQTRDVFVERFIIKDTIEDRILAMQEKKKLLADSSLGEGDGRKLGRLSVRELAALFNLNVA